MKIKIENIKGTLEKILTQLNFSLLSGKEVEVKPSVFVKLIGKMEFAVAAKGQGIEITFKIAPQIRVDKFLQFYGDLTSIYITPKAIYLSIDGLPDVELEVVS